jgi:hypothetical protein
MKTLIFRGIPEKNVIASATPCGKRLSYHSWFLSPHLAEMRQAEPLARILTGQQHAPSAGQVQSRAEPAPSAKLYFEMLRACIATPDDTGLPSSNLHTGKSEMMYAARS